MAALLLVRLSDFPKVWRAHSSVARGQEAEQQQTGAAAQVAQLLLRAAQTRVQSKGLRQLLLPGREKEEGEPDRVGWNHDTAVKR